MRGFGRHAAAIGLLVALLSFANSDPVQAQADLPSCSTRGWIDNSSVIAQGCNQTGGAGPTVEPGELPPVYCTYTLIVSDDLTDDSAMWRTGSAFGKPKYNSGPASEVSQAEIEIADITLTPSDTGAILSIGEISVRGRDRLFSPSGRWYAESCRDRRLNNQEISYRNPVPLGRPQPVGAALENALTRLNIASANSFTSSGGNVSILQLPTFFWIENFDFDSVERSVSDPFGRLAVVAEADPREYRLEFEDGTDFTCPGENLPWQRGVEVGTPGTCSHRFDEPPEGATEVSVEQTIFYEASWYAVNAATGARVSGYATNVPLGDIPVPSEPATHQIVEVVGLSSAG